MQDVAPAALDDLVKADIEATWTDAT